jgi:hypothetical protein
MAKYDTGRLIDLGQRMREHAQEGRILRDAVRSEIPKARDKGVSFATIARLLPMSGERARQIYEEVRQNRGSRGRGRDRGAAVDTVSLDVAQVA